MSRVSDRLLASTAMPAKGPQGERGRDSELGNTSPPDALVQLTALLARYDDLKQRLGFPGDFGERAFRGWLVLDVLQQCYGWDSERLVFGEVYDLLLLSRNRLPVVTIETKIPSHRPTPTDIRSFENRLHHYATLHYAYFTDGYVWRRLHLAAPSGMQVVLDDQSASLGDGASLRTLLEPLAAKRY